MTQITKTYENGVQRVETATAYRFISRGPSMFVCWDGNVNIPMCGKLELVYVEDK